MKADILLVGTKFILPKIYTFYFTIDSATVPPSLRLGVPSLTAIPHSNLTRTTQLCRLMSTFVTLIVRLNKRVNQLATPQQSRFERHLMRTCFRKPIKSLEMTTFFTLICCLPNSTQMKVETCSSGVITIKIKNTIWKSGGSLQLN